MGERLIEWQKEQSARGYRPEELSQWLMPSNALTLHVVWLLHGLNLHPARMRAFAEIFHQKNLPCFQTTLTGHGGEEAEAENVSLKDWMEDLTRSYQIIQEENPQAKIIVFAYSLGATLLEYFLHQIPQTKISQIINLAPALKNKFLPNAMIRISFKLPLDKIPSLNLTDYRKHDFTSINAYQALLQAQELIEKRGLAFQSIPRTIFLNPRDELVHFESVKKFYESQMERANQEEPAEKPKEISNGNSTGKINLIEFHKDPGVKGPQHLMVSQASVGQKAWGAFAPQIHDLTLE